MARKPRWKTAYPRPRHAAGGPVEELSCDGRSVALQCSPFGSRKVAVQPVNAYSLAVACGGRGVSRRHRSRQPSARRPPRAAPTRGHDIGSLLCHARDLAPRPVAFCTPDRSSGPRGYRAPQRNGRRGVAPLRARPRRGARCPCGASTALPRDCGEARWAPSGAATNARRFVRRRPPKAASDCGAQYHAIITPASLACLADPLPLLAWMPI